MSKCSLVNSIFAVVNLNFCIVGQKPGDQGGASSKIIDGKFGFEAIYNSFSYIFGCSDQFSVMLT